MARRDAQPTDPHAPDEFRVEGRVVTLYGALPVRRVPRLVQLMSQFAETRNGDDVVRLLSLIVASWEFEGEPADPRSYQSLDLFDEVLAMGEKAARALNARMDRGRDAVSEGEGPNDLVLRDRRFTVRKRIPLSLAPRLPGLVVRFGETGDAADLIKMLALVAESSDLVSEPNDPRAYQDVDLFDLLPIGERVIRYLNDKLEIARTRGN